MPTRLRKPSIFKRLAITAGLIGLQVYLGYSALGGNYGITALGAMKTQLVALDAQEQAIDAEIATFRDRIALLDPARLDPDLLTERARELLGLADPRDVIVPLDAD